MENKVNKKILLILFVMFFVCCIFSIPFAESIDINGVYVHIDKEVNREVVGYGINTNEEYDYFDVKEEFEKRKEKETKDKDVFVELIIKNNNPYETAIIKIKEKTNANFKQYDIDKIDSKLEIALKPNEQKVLNYSYHYEKNFILDLFESIFDRDKEKKVNYEKFYYEDDINKTDINPEENKEDITIKHTLNNNSKPYSIVILILISGIVGLSIAFITYIFIKNIIHKNNDDNINLIIFTLLCAIIVNLIFYKPALANSFIPNIYIKGHVNTGRINTIVLFNERYYEFLYEIEVEYENKNEITNENIDTDGDGLNDALEYLYMTDKNDKDTDGDGLNDYLELIILGYNPNSKWTFNDARNDGYRDYDGDGLSNIKEIDLGTDLTMQDTDGDNLNDYDEVNGVLSNDGEQFYITSPLLIDTDNDGLNDDEEIKLGLDPTNEKTDGINIDSERKILQSYNTDLIQPELKDGDISIESIKSEVEGDIDTKIKINTYHNSNLNNTNFLVSKPFVFSNDSNNVVEIKFNVNNVSERIDKLIIVKYEDQIMIPIETKFTENTISGILDENGIYCVADAELVLKELNIYVKNYLE